MKLINSDKLRNDVLEWMPPDPCGQEFLEAPFDQELMQDPNNVGNKRYVLSWLLERWKNESERNN